MVTRVLVVDDSPLTQRRLQELIVAQPGFTVAGTASNGLAAIEAARALRPDLMTLDLNMPVMDGLTTLKHVMALCPVRTVVVSSFATRESHLTFDCLRYGAVDFFTKPSSLEGGLSPEKQQEIGSCLRRAAAIAPGRLCYRRARPKASVPPQAGVPRTRGALVFISGHSGIAWLLQALGGVDCSGGIATLVLLEGAAAEVESFALYAARFSANGLAQGVDGQLGAGAPYIVANPPPLLVVGEMGQVRLRTYRPPVGANAAAMHRALLSSLGETFGPGASVIILSGAPKEALEGLAEVVSRGGRVFAQDPDTALEPEVLAAAVQRHGAHPLESWGAVDAAALVGPQMLSA